MAETYKILGKISPADNKEHVLYATTSGKQAIITNITATNKSSSPVTVDINYYDSAITETDLEDVVSGTSGFVAVLGSQGTGSNLGYSADGITWTSNQVGQQSNWQDIAYGNGKYVALEKYGSAIAHSTDGVSWSVVYPPQGAEWGYTQPSQLAFGQGVFSFIANGQEAVTPWYSTDGATWTRGTVNGSSQGTLSVVEFYSAYFNLAYGNGVFVTTTDNNSGCLYATSTDGINWTQPQQGGQIGQGQIDLDDLAYVNDKFIGVSSNNGMIIYSTNGTSWSITYPPEGQGEMSIAYAFGYYWLGYGSTLYKSTFSGQEIFWEYVQLPQGAISGTTKSAYNDGVLAIGSDYSSNVLYTLNGTSWNTASLPNQHGILNINERGGLGTSSYVSPLSKAIYKNLTIAANDFEVLEPGIVMSPQDTIVVKGSSSTNISIYGMEIS